MVTREELDRLRDWNFAIMLEAICGEPKVRERFPALGGVHSVEDLPRLPFLSPADLQELSPPRSFDLVLGGRDNPGLVLRSSGSSGQTKILYHSWQFTAQVGLLGTRGLRSALREPPRRIANCVPAANLNGAYEFVQMIGDYLPALTFPCGADMDMAELRALIADHHIDTVVAMPAFARELVLAARPDRPGRPRSVLYLGAPLPDDSQADMMAAVPTLTVRSLSYSTSETGPIGYQCSYLGNDTHHVHEDAVVVEVIDAETGQSLPDGSAGEVVVTPLSDTGMALLRYRVGDRGVLNAGECRCGSPAKLLTLLGRVSGSILVDSTALSAPVVMAQLAAFGITDPASCQFRVRWSSAYGAQVYDAELLLIRGVTPAGLASGQVLEQLCKAYPLRKVLQSRRCRSFSVHYADRADLGVSSRGKAPFFHQLPDHGRGL
jgi:phenylacetate-CoA ligase